MVTYTMANRQGFVLLVVDQIIVFCVISPLVIVYWRGTWQLEDIYITPDDPKPSAWISFAIGNAGMWLLTVLAPCLRKMKTDKLCSFKWVVGYHLYTYIGALIGVTAWRGTWQLLDLYTGFTVISNAVTIAIALVLLYMLRASKSCVTPPAVCVMDIDENLLECTTRFNTRPSDRENFILDTILTAVVIHSLVVFFWRGAWGLLDLLLFPGDIHKSSAVSLGAAAVIYAVLITIQIILIRCQQSFHKHLLRRVFLDFVLSTVGSCVAVLQWRGIWYFFDLYVFPDEPEISFWLSHGVGYGGLAILLCSASNVVKGYFADGSTFKEPSNSVLANKYIQFFVEWKESKRNVQRKDLGYTGNMKDIDTNSTTVTACHNHESECTHI